MMTSYNFFNNKMFYIFKIKHQPYLYIKYCMIHLPTRILIDGNYACFFCFYYQVCLFLIEKYLVVVLLIVFHSFIIWCIFISKFIILLCNILLLNEREQYLSYKLKMVSILLKCYCSSD